MGVSPISPSFIRRSQILIAKFLVEQLLEVVKGLGVLVNILDIDNRFFVSNFMGSNVVQLFELG